MMLGCRQYTIHTILKVGGGSYSFVLIDTIGLEKLQPTEKIIKLALKGHLRNGFKVSRSVNLSGLFPSPTVLLCCIPSSRPVLIFYRTHCTTPVRSLQTRGTSQSVSVPWTFNFRWTTRSSIGSGPLRWRPETWVRASVSHPLSLLLCLKSPACTFGNTHTHLFIYVHIYTYTHTYIKQNYFYCIASKHFS